jgi:hypothetical protein
MHTGAAPVVTQREPAPQGGLQASTQAPRTHTKSARQAGVQAAVTAGSLLHPSAVRSTGTIQSARVIRMDPPTTMRAVRREASARGLPVLTLCAVSAVLLGVVPGRRRRCPAGSVSIAGAFCIDAYEGSLLEMLPRGRTRPWSPYITPAPGGRYRARSVRGVAPQAYISQVQASRACAAAGRRLCTEAEWERACKGPAPSPWPYGPSYQRGRCNDGREGPVPRLYGTGNVFHERQMNDPRLNQLPGTLARAGAHARCRNRYGVFDMVGNLHEWTATVRNGRGVFRGGYYVDVRINGEGCGYATRAHGVGYHDYSTGFRCCADL